MFTNHRIQRNINIAVSCFRYSCFCKQDIQFCITDTGAQWGAWMEWNKCSVSCKKGWVSRQRVCQESHTGNLLSKSQCFGLHEEYKTCSLGNCPSKYTPVGHFIFVFTASVIQ